MQQIFSIYKVRNKINQKIYIGFTFDIDKRRILHERHSFDSNCNSYNHYFHNAIRKYGKDAFEWEVIYQSHDKEYMLKTAESFFIVEYDSIKNGYNLTKGGEGFLGKHTEESKLKMSKSKKGKVSWNKGRPGKKGKENPFFGKTHSEETRKKLSIAAKKRTGMKYKRKNLFI